VGIMRKRTEKARHEHESIDMNFSWPSPVPTTRSPNVFSGESLGPREHGHVHPPSRVRFEALHDCPDPFFIQIWR